MMDPLIEHVSQFIIRERLLSTGARVIVGLSGGADSVALLAILSLSGYKCTAAHCNFHLRGEESVRDEEHSRNIAANLGADFECVGFNVQKHMDSCRRPTSVEMACRDLRYEWFETIRKKHDAEAIAVAHNADDNIETLFLNIIRGTGLSGARGILPANDRHIIRPLLHTSRSEIEEFLQRSAIGFVTDSTNLQSIYRRNCLRLDVLPELYRNFPSARSGLTTTLDHLRQADRFLQESISIRISPFILQDGGIDIRGLAGKDTSSTYLLFEHLRHIGLTYSQAQDICSAPDRNGARFPVSKNRVFLLYNGILRLHLSETSSPLPPLETIFEISELPIEKFHPSGRKDEAYFDADMVDTAKLYIRHWHHGDRLRPFGMKGSRAVSDIFNTARVSSLSRTEIPLLCLGEDILWVPPIRASRLYTVTPATTRFLKIRYKIGNNSRNFVSTKF